MNQEQQTLQIIKHHWKSKKKKFIIHNCSICQYPCGFYWENEQLMFDAGCWCTQEQDVSIRNDDDLTDFIKKNPEVIEKNFKAENIRVS